MVRSALHRGPALSWRWLWLLPILLPAAAAEPADDGRLRLLTQWNDDYLFVAVVVEDLHLVGRHGRPGSPVWLDDDIEIFLTSNTGNARLDSDCHWLGMSAAGGLLFRRGDRRGDGDWVAAETDLLAARFRQSLQLRGTLNDRRDADSGWQVECAIPWRALQVAPPTVGQAWRCNLVLHRRGQRDLRYSYFPAARAAEATNRPATWGRLIFREQNPGIVAGEANEIVCPRAAPPQRVGDRTVPRPLVDGRLADGEWPLLYRADAEFEASHCVALKPELYGDPPAAMRRLPAGCELEGQDLPPATAPAAWQGERLVLATYYLDDLPARQQPLGTHPYEGLGPWNSARRPGYHYDLLTAAARAGVDALVVRYPAGDPAAEQALGALLQAAWEARRQRQTVPQLAVLVPLASLANWVGAPVDLTQALTAEALYRTVREFYARVPPELRLQLPDRGRLTCLVALDDPLPGLRADALFRRWCEARFQAEFGAGLRWLGGSGWERRAGPFDGYVQFDAGRGGQVALAPWATAAVGPGLANFGEAPAWRDRDGIRTFRADLTRVLRTPPELLLLQSWNGFRQGDALVATQEFGRQHEAAVRVAALQFNSPQDGGWIAKLRRTDLPPRLVAGQPLTVMVQLANGGLREWTLEEQVQLTYRWYSERPEPVLKPDGSPLTDSRGQPLERLLALSDEGRRSNFLVPPLPTGELQCPLEVEARDRHGQPLPPGRYRLRFDAVAGQIDSQVPLLDDRGNPVLDEKGKPRTRAVSLPRWFSVTGDPTSDLLVEVIAPEQAPAVSGHVLAAGLPPRLEQGGAQPLLVAVRNEGREPWDERVQLGYRWVQCSPRDPCAIEPAPQAIGEWSPGGSVIGLLNAAGRAAWERIGETPGVARPAFEPRRSVAAGERLEVPLSLPVSLPGGRPWPAPSPAARWRLQLALLRDGQPLPACRPWEQQVELLARDWGVDFAAVSAPDTARGGEPLAVEARLSNTGRSPWPAGCAVAWHWFYWDGEPLQRDVKRLPLPGPVAAGASVAVAGPLPAPAFPGQYHLVAELLLPGEVWSSDAPATRRRDLGRTTVVVTRGEVRLIDLAAVATVAGIVSSANRQKGDFDGAGRALPAELVPPGAEDSAAGLYPSGYRQRGAANWQRTVGFWYPAAGSAASVVVPAGQSVALPTGRYRRLHLLLAAVGDDLETTFAVVPADRRNDEPAVALAPTWVTAWTSAPRHGELVGLQVPVQRGRDGDNPQQPCWLHHLVLPTPSDRPLAALLLPREPRLRLVALTAEPLPLPPPGPPAP
ncbi:MAG: carbohydrate-binding family 9-like protein [Fimbriimonadaceae bacterium]|nr:carbohydrate-binding family 9-like protein [Fimbriimonadaceae bacterium]